MEKQPDKELKTTTLKSINNLLLTLGGFKMCDKITVSEEKRAAT